jgi:uncharacterized protein YkwD
VALALTTAFAVGFSPAVIADASVNPKSRASVTAAYNNKLVPALATRIGWTGSVSGCDEGSISPQAQDATETAVNFMRELSGLSPVSFTSNYSAKAQDAALAYLANQSLSHEIPTTWRCYSRDAKTAGLKSNIAYGTPVAGPKAILGYMEDPGSGNTAVGHRRWVLNPKAATMGSGSTHTTQVLYVMGKNAKKYKNPKWVEWPSAGYFPEQLEPNGRWSLTGNASYAYSFKKAKVTVRDSKGKKLKVTKKYVEHDGYGNDTLVWRVAGVKGAAGDSVAKYTVKVSGIKKGSKKLSHTYTVKMFDPTAK